MCDKSPGRTIPEHSSPLNDDRDEKAQESKFDTCMGTLTGLMSLVTAGLLPFSFLLKKLTMNYASSKAIFALGLYVYSLASLALFAVFVAKRGSAFYMFYVKHSKRYCVDMYYAIWLPLRALFLIIIVYIIFEYAKEESDLFIDKSNIRGIVSIYCGVCCSFNFSLNFCIVIAAAIRGEQLGASSEH